MTARQIRYDTEADALYVAFREPHGQVRTWILDDFRFIDHDEDDTIVGVEFIEVSKGLNLHGFLVLTK